ncbi:MAG: hypothetical protein ACYDHY_15250 [Acidiferrobacterales bacterium]
MDTEQKVEMLTERISALEIAVLVLIECHAGYAGLPNSKAGELSGAIEHAREAYNQENG